MGRGKGESETPGGGDRFFFWKIPGGGGAFQDGRGRGAGRVSASNSGIFGGGGLNIFVFWGGPKYFCFEAEMSTKLFFGQLIWGAVMQRLHHRNFRSQKGLTKPKNHTNSTKYFSEQSGGGCWVITQQNKGFEANRTRKFTLSHSFFVQKKPDVRDFSARNSGARNGCYGRLAFFWFFLLDNPMPINSSFWGGGWKGGGSANLIFMGVGIFLICGTFLSVLV